MRTIKFASLTCFCFAALFALATELPAQDAQANWAERFESKMTPGLEKALASLPDGETLDVYAVMKQRMSRTDLEKMTGAVPVGERHRIVADALRGFADQTQTEVRALLAKQGPTAYRVLWLSNAVRFTGNAGLVAAVRDLDSVGYVGVIEKYAAETYQDAGSPAPAIYYDGFESGGFGPEWATATTGTGRIQVTTANDPIGVYHVTMDSSTSGTDSTCSMTLTIDLSSQTNCYLDFMFKAFSDESNTEDAIYISEDGVAFYKVLGLSGGSVYEQKFVDLDEAAAGAGISFNSSFRIRFSWADNYPIPTDGFAFDEINILDGDPPPTPPTSNIVKLQAPLCWDIGIDGDGSLILNIDSGVDYTHPDLVNQIWSNPNEIPGNGIDDDSNGYVDDTNGWDFESNDNDPYPTSYHGTATAGIVCGDGTNGTKTGMAPDATMAIAKIGDEGDYWEAQQYSVLIGANAITSSYSYKWGIHDPDYHMFRQNCVNELLAGVIHANSIGNQGNDTSGFPIPFNISTPGNCPGPWIHPDQVVGGTSSVLGCAGVELDESLYTYSGQGPSAWENMITYDPGYGHTQNPLFWDYPYGGWSGPLPGLLKPDVCTYTNVVTTDIGGGYNSSFGGTSAATPHLGGAMCLLISANEHASPRKLSQALQETAEDKGPAGKDSRYGAGKVQVYDAAMRILVNVEADNQKPSIGDTVGFEVSGIPGETFALAWSLSRGSHTIPWLGTLEIAAPINTVLIDVIPPSGARIINITVPNNSYWAGKDVFFQAAMDDRTGATGQFVLSLVEDVEIQP